MKKLTVNLNNETALKLERRAKRAGMSVAEALRLAASNPEIFLRKMVGATNSAIK